MINQINTNNINNTSFKSKESSLAQNFTTKEKFCYGFINQREKLASARFVQDVTTNWIPKVVFTRSLADFTEMSFLEYTESALFYFAPTILFKAFNWIFNAFSQGKAKKDIKEKILSSTEDLIRESKNPADIIAKKATSRKAAIVLASMAIIPAGEYALSFAKNLLTLNVFKKSNFDNIANLNKENEQAENKEHQEKVRKSANEHIKKSAEVSAIGVVGASILAAVGHKTETLQKISRGILRPCNVISKTFEAIGIKSKKLTNALNKYVNFDCNINRVKNKNGEIIKVIPELSTGQLAASTIIGFLGYSAAGADRGKLDQLETWTRVPIVVLYTIFGSEAFDWAFKHILHKKNMFPDLIKKDGNSNSLAKIPGNQELEKLAEKLATERKTNVEQEFKRLVKEKAFISAVPYGFALIFMGFLLAGISRFWTQYRFDHQNKGQKTISENVNVNSKTSGVVSNIASKSEEKNKKEFFSFFPTSK